MMESNDYENAVFPTRCSLCKRLFQLENGMRPKLLPCLHTFCEDCIRLQCKDERFTCPLDSQECRNVQGVMDQYFLLEKLNKDKLTIESTRDNPCEGCASEENGNEQLKPSATGYCKQCSDWLCDSCIAAHRKVRLTKEHEILSHDEYKMSMANEVGKWHFCIEHPNQMLCLFCDACQSLTCRSCHADKAKHQQHPCQFLNLKASNEKSVVAKLVEEVNEKQEGVKKQHLELFRHKANVRIVQNTVSDQIESCFREICEKLDQRKKELLQFVVTQCSDAEKKIEMQNERLTKVEKIMKFAVSFSQKAIAFDQPFPLMKTRVALLSQLRNLTKIPLQSLTVDQVDIKFSFDNSTMDALIKQVGQINNSKQSDSKQQPSDSPKKTQNPAISVPSLNIKTETSKESRCGGDSGVSSVGSDLNQPVARGRGRPPAIRGASRGRPRGGGVPANIQNMSASIARAVAHRPTRGRGMVKSRKQVPAVLQKQMKYRRPAEILTGPGSSPNEMISGNPGIQPRINKQQPVPVAMMSPKLTSPSKKVISPMKSHFALSRAPEPEQAAVIRPDMSSALVPMSSIPAPMPSMRFQSPPRFPGSPIHQSPFSRSPPQAPPRVVANEHYQQWKNVFPSRTGPEIGMLREPEHMAATGIHQAPMHDQVVYEKRYQEYAMRTNMMQAQPNLHGGQQMIIRTATEYVRPAFHRTSPITGQTMVSPSIVGLPQPPIWQSRAIEGPPSMAAIPYEQDPRSNRQSMVPFMEAPQITMEGEFMPSGVFAPMKSPALPSVSSLSRASSENCPPIKKPKIAENSPRVTVKNEQQAVSPCAIVELDTPPRSVSNSNRGFSQQLMVSEALVARSNNDETFVTEPKIQIPEVIDLEEATNIVRNIPLDSWSRDSAVSLNGQKSSRLPTNPHRSDTLPSFASSQGEAEEEQSQAQALACELMRLVCWICFLSQQ
ncbi:uncharacterized protein LOC142349712 [Convolutriloba macropyga]|uniref:uncharacterized protein LOC142349712 n=1 Tax=Convolutriloba macropyga TaxID=536237 RepID=UPI003F5268A7